MDTVNMKILALALLMSIACVTEQKEVRQNYATKNVHMVKFVRQNYIPEINSQIEDHIQIELEASYIYQAYASYFQRADVSLLGIQKFFSDASLDHREHAQKFIEYGNKRGGHANFGPINLKKSCIKMVKKASRDKGPKLHNKKRGYICDFVVTDRRLKDGEELREGLVALEDALVIERFINGELLKLHDQTVTVRDPDLSHLLEHQFMDYQVHVIYEIGQHVTRLRRFASGKGLNYKLGEYIFDEHLHKKED